MILGGDGYLGWSLGLAFGNRTDENVVLVDNFVKRQWEEEVNAKLLVPVLADWISIDVVSDEKTSQGACVTKNIALYNRDPQRIDLYKKYIKKY